MMEQTRKLKEEEDKQEEYNKTHTANEEVNLTQSYYFDQSKAKL